MNWNHYAYEAPDARKARSEGIIGSVPETTDTDDGSTMSSRESRLLLPEGERLVTVFLLLKDPIGWPQQRPFTFTEYLNPQTLHLLEEMDGSCLTGPTELDPVHLGDVLLRGSVLFRRVVMHGDEASGMAPVMRAFTTGFPVTSKASAAEPAPLEVETVVAEVTIPIKTALLLRAAEEGLATVEVGDVTEPDESAVQLAYDVAVELVRRVQRSYVAVAREPVELVSMQTQPPLLPYGVRDGDKPPDDKSSMMGFYLVPGNLRHISPPQELTEELLARVHEAGQSPDPLLAYTDLYNQAMVALHRHGSTRECIVMLGTASEALVDMLLALLHWERGLTPEESAAKWRESVEKRVTAVLPGLIGGHWSVAANGPVQEWHSQVYSLRNRVVHSGYMPTEPECALAFAGLNQLVSHIADRLMDRSQLSRFPRTVTLLFSNRWESTPKPQWLQDLQDDPSEVKWSHTAARWMEAQRLCRADRVVPRAPSADRAELAAVATSTDEATFVLVLIDPDTALACTARPVSDDWFESALKTLRLLASRHDFSLGEMVVSVPRDASGDVVPDGPWIDRYHLVPSVGVMVDGSDLHPSLLARMAAN